MAARADRATTLLRRLTSSGEDPRPLQVGVALLVSLDLLVRVLGGARYDVVSGPVLGLTLLVAVTAVTLFLPWRRLSWNALAVLAVLDIAVVGLCRLSPEGSGVAIVVVLPALWLGQTVSWRGPALCGAAGAALLALPSTLYFGVDGADLSRSVLPCLVAVGVAAARSAARRAIEREQRITDAVFDTVDVGLLMLDRDGGYLRLNRRHADFMRLAFPHGHAGVAGQLGKVYAADGATLLTQDEMPTRRATRGEEFDDCRIWIGEGSGRRALSVSARTVHDETGARAGAALAYHDVTEYMRALSVKDEFVAAVSHELRTPLTSIAGYVQILQEREDLPGQVQRQLDVVARNGERLLRLIGDLLHTAQADQDGLSLERRRCDLVPVVREAVQAAAPSAEAAGVQLSCRAPDALTADVDPQRFAQVVDNLVSNAVKYSERGDHVRVLLGLDGDRVELEVRDTGMGITAADRDRLFTRFFRAAQPADRAVAGAGLGLSITKQIVESHGGRIEVASELGVGSSFRVRLPVAAD